MVPVNSRDKKTLLDILDQHMLPGSIIHTDLWKGYLGMENIIEVEHRTVNHSKGFKDKDTGAHTNSNEGTWNGVKLNIRPCNRVENGMEKMLFEFIW